MAILGRQQPKTATAVSAPSGPGPWAWEDNEGELEAVDAEALPASMS